MAKHRLDYTEGAVEAAKTVLIELTHLLSEYRDDIVLVGGWIPPLLLTDATETQVGSIDVDLALNQLAFRMVFGFTLISMLPMAAFGQQRANPEANTQNAITYLDRRESRAASFCEVSIRFTA